MASRFWVGGTGTWDASTTTNWSATSGGAGGQSVPGASDTVTFDASSGGGTVTVGTGYNPSVTSITMGAFTGTLDFSAFNNSPTMQTFNCSGTGVRTLNMGSGTWTLTGSGATIWTTLTTTNLTLTATTANIVCNYSGSTGTRTLQCSSPIVLPNVSITAGSDTTNLSSNDTFACTNLSFAGFTGTWSTGNHSVAGNFTLGAGMTMGTGGNTLTMNATSGIKTFTSNGVTFADRLLTFNGVGGTWQLTDALVGTATRTLTLTNGTFDSNNQNVTFGLFSSSNSNTRTLTMGSGTWTLTGTGTIWNTATSTNLTVNKGFANISVANQSATSKTLSGDGGTYNYLFFQGVLSSLTITNMFFLDSHLEAYPYPNQQTPQEAVNNKLGSVGMTKQQVLARLAGITETATIDVIANNYAGTTGRTAQEALNVKVSANPVTTFTKGGAERRL